MILSRHVSDSQAIQDTAASRDSESRDDDVTLCHVTKDLWSLMWSGRIVNGRKPDSTGCTVSR